MLAYGRRSSKEMSELFVLRKDGAPSPAPTQRLVRAHSLGRIGQRRGAISEVSAMPGVSAAQCWLSKAKRYAEARKALDMLERGAIVAQAPVAPPVAPPPVTFVPPETIAPCRSVIFDERLCHKSFINSGSAYIGSMATRFTAIPGVTGIAAEALLRPCLCWRAKRCPLPICGPALRLLRRYRSMSKAMVARSW